MEVDGDQVGNRHAIHHRRPHGHSLNSAVVSGDSDQDYEESEADDSVNEEDIFDDVGDYSATDRDFRERALLRYNPNNPAYADELYDQNLDEEDEAYVYRNMRGGVEETVMVRQQDNNGSPQPKFDDDDAELHQSSHSSSQPMKVLKPRNSDAVLSCPCCMKIVTMDCQRHQRYMNQFRAMFVMGIMVDWHTRLIYDEDQQHLVPKPEENPNFIPPDNTHTLNEIGEISEGGQQFREGEYFPVLCGNCRTQVAALDMVEEVYHFSGCLESSF